MEPKLSRESYRGFLETIPDAALLVDRSGVIVHASSLAARLFRVSASALTGLPVHELVPEDRRASHSERVAAYWREARVRRMGESDFSARRPDGSLFPADIMLSPVSLAEGDMALCVIRDLSEQKAQEAALKAALARERHLALSDPLVGVANKRHLELALAHEIEQLRRHGRPFTLIYLDLDQFKPLNDQHGHAEGDKVLKALGAFLQANVRKTDLVARVGGDEFVVLMVETNAKSARQRVPELFVAVQSFFRASPWSVTSSVGATVLADPPESVEDALSRADALMLMAKRHGRDRCFARYVASRDGVESCDTVGRASAIPERHPVIN